MTQNTLPITKMQGLGNNFIVLDHRKPFLKDPEATAKKICDVHFGIGADGLILVESSKTEDVRMRIFNADGSEPEMCGNGIRCFSRFVKNKSIFSGDELSVETLAGQIKTKILPNGLVKVDMGVPATVSADLVLEKARTLERNLRQVDIDGRLYHFISMGNPHAVSFVENYQFDYLKVGEMVENNRSIFPKKTNVEFIKVENRHELTMRVWERGCGETYACGTGACASAAAAMLSGRVDTGKVIVHLLGGDLEIEWSGEGHLMMTGPAETVLDGSYLISES
jgi:diaminopimelate epimerase